MTDIGESISIPEVDGPWECPFDHEAQTHDKKNVLPPPDTKNDSAKLGKNIGEEQQLSVSIDGKSCDAKLAAHHILPGSEAWPKSDLHKWVNKEDKNHVNGDIEYDVNAADNGVNLWDDEHFDSASMTKQDYAFGLMKAKAVQFHDRHPAYSEWIINRLNKIAIRLDEEVKGRGGKGCGKDKCPLEGQSEPPYDPPYHLKGRLYGMAKSVKQYLVGSSSSWRMPLMTSRFALMYKENVTKEAARKRMKAARKQLEKSRGG